LRIAILLRAASNQSTGFQCRRIFRERLANSDFQTGRDYSFFGLNLKPGKTVYWYKNRITLAMIVLLILCEPTCGVSSIRMVLYISSGLAIKAGWTILAIRY